MQRSPGTYSAGTIQGTAGQPIIIGTGTAWATTDATGTVSNQVAAYDDLVLPGQRPFMILSVDGVGQLILSENLPFGIPAGSAYKIIRRTPVVSSAVLGVFQQLLTLGSDANPDLARTIDNGVSRLKIDFDGSGKIRFRVGATGADGSAQNPYFLALLIDPATGNVTATGLTGSGTGSGVQIISTVGPPSNAIGLPGWFAIDGAGVLYGPKSANNKWSAGLSLVGPANDPTMLNNAVAAAVASAGQAATSAQQAAASAQQAAGTSSLGLNGYQKLPSGVIVQWGYVPSGGNNDLDVFFPIAFPSVCRGVYTIPVGAPDGVSSASAVPNYSGGTKFTVYRRALGASGPSAASFPVNWLAVGN